MMTDKERAKSYASYSRRMRRYYKSKEYMAFLRKVHNAYFKHLVKDSLDPHNIVGYIVKKDLYDELFEAIEPGARFISTMCGNMPNIMMNGKPFACETRMETKADGRPI
jgi:hypothetical protein